MLHDVYGIHVLGDHLYRCISCKQSIILFDNNCSYTFVLRSQHSRPRLHNSRDANKGIKEGRGDGMRYGCTRYMKFDATGKLLKNRKNLSDKN